MCQFTRIVWHSCGHDKLSTTPEHTFLCTTGIFKLRQGVSSAPACCHPLPDDLINVQRGYASNKIAQTNFLFDSCSECKSNPDLGVKVPTPIVPLVEARGDYSDDDEIEIASLRDMYLSNTRQCEAAMQSLEAALDANSESKTAVENIRNHTIRNLLHLPSGERYSHILSNSLLEARELLDVLHLFKRQGLPIPLFSALCELVRNKLYQNNARRDIVCQLTKNLEEYANNPIAYEAALEYNAEQLALRLGQVNVPDAVAYAHLSAEAPLHAQHTVAVKDRVRRHEINGCVLALVGKYGPRPSFGILRNKNVLRIDSGKARNPPPGTEDINGLPKVEDLDIEYGSWSETRNVLSPMGIGRGPWGISSVYEDQEAATGSGDALSGSQGVQEKEQQAKNGHLDSASERDVHGSSTSRYG